MMEDGHCVATVHAEANAIIQAAKNGVAIDGATIYTTASPCWPCFKLIANGGCHRIVFGEFYRDARIFEFAQRLGIELVELDVPARPDVQPADTGSPHARRPSAVRTTTSKLPGCPTWIFPLPACVSTSGMPGPLFFGFCSEQIKIAGVPKPTFFNGRFVASGIVEGTRIGYIYIWSWDGDAVNLF